MMTMITVEELELLTFFEVEPELCDPATPWPYNDFIYQLQLGQYHIHFGISPAYRDVSIRIRHADIEIYSLNALSVKDVSYQKNAEGESLDIRISDSEHIVFKLRPHFSIAQNLADRS